MCELLVFVKNNANPDAVKDRRGCYKRGFVVCAFEDNHVWGREESKQQWILEGKDPVQWSAKFVIIKIPAVPAAKAQLLLERQTEDDAGVPLTDANGNPVAYRRRRWSLLVDNIPNVVKNTLLTNGEITVTVAQIRNYIKRIRDAAQYTGLD